MAQKARKDRAKANTEALNRLHIGSVAVNVSFLVLALTLLRGRRSLVAYGVLSLPALACELVLERSGRPSYDAATGALKNAGEDLAAPGLTEYMFDIVWVTWASALLVLLAGNWGWLLWATVPAYGGYMAYGLMGAAGRMRSGLAAAGAQGGSGQPQGAQQGNRKQRRAAAS